MEGLGWGRVYEREEWEVVVLFVSEAMLISMAPGLGNTVVEMIVGIVSEAVVNYTAPGLGNKLVETVVGLVSEALVSSIYVRKSHVVYWELM